MLHHSPPLIKLYCNNSRIKFYDTIRDNSFSFLSTDAYFLYLKKLKLLMVQNINHDCFNYFYLLDQ